MTTRWKVTFDAINPSDLKGHWEIGISPAHIDRLKVHGHEAPLARILLVRYVVAERPLMLFGGWSRPEMEDCYVYAGLPDRDYQSRTIEMPPPPGMMFLVFVERDGTIDHWTWRSSTDGMPDGIKGVLLWSANQT